MSFIKEFAVPFLFVVFLVSRYWSLRTTRSLNVPTVTFAPFVPNFVTRLLFFVGGRYLVHKGYKKYKDIPFRILKVDGDVIVLPVKYLPQIRLLDHTHISLIDAQSASVCGEYINILLGTSLPSITVGKKMTPALNRLIPRVIDELDHAFAVELPKCEEDWSQINFYFTILRLITRSTSRIIVGDNLCRDEEWLQTITKYSEKLGLTLVCLRPLPLFLRPLAAKLLPSVRYLKKTLEHVKDDIFVPVILARREAEAYDRKYQKPDDFIQWMMDTADNDFDREPGNIAYGVMAIMALAITHTTTMLITQGLYDLMIHPEYLQPLKREIRSTLKSGWANATVRDFTSQRLMDSFLRESQRLNPSSEYNVHRMTKQPIIFTDGFTLPTGTYFVFPSGPLSLDPSFVKKPLIFDGYRWCREQSLMTQTQTRNYQSLVTINETNLHFGYGRDACPGRFFAAHASKALLCRLLIEYDIKLLDDQDGVRPANIRNGEHVIPNIFTQVLVQKSGETI
ncbi:cytochrome P450 [Aspergillus crustosus]